MNRDHWIVLITLLTLTMAVNADGKSAEYFIAQKSCIVFPEGEKNNKLSIGFSYKVNKIDASKVYIYMNDKIVDVDKNCGAINSFISFFNGIDAKLNLPTEPTLNSFDNQILQICGRIGKDVRAAEFLKIFENYMVFNTIYENLDNSIKYGYMQSIADFKKMFADIWLKSDGFRKIFCGVIVGNDLRGLNYIGRYVDGYNNGWIGYDKSCPKNENKYPVYNLGVFYVTPEGKVRNQCSTNYSYSLGAIDLLIEITNAYKQFSQSNGDCIYRLYNNDYSYDAILTKKNDAIFSFNMILHPKCPYEECVCK